MKISKKKLKELIIEEISKDIELSELFGNLFNSKKQGEDYIKIDDVIGEKQKDGNWEIYTNSRKDGDIPHLLWGKVKIHPDGLMIFTYYSNVKSYVQNKGKHSYRNVQKERFKITEVRRAVQYVSDKLREEKEKERAYEKERKDAERSFDRELD